jgi:competence protein ComEC
MSVALLSFGLYLQRPQNVPAGGDRIYFLNVGQGDSTLIKTKSDKYVLIDGGPDKSVLSELGEVMPPTNRTIEAVVLTHPHADHVAGLNYVLDRYTINNVYMTGAVHTAPDYKEFLERLKKQGVATHKAYLGQDFSVDDFNFRTLYPITDISGQTLKDQNDGSVVLDVSAQGRHVLMLGDLSARVQDKNIIPALAGQGFDILKVSHHGSKTGTSVNVLAAIKPKFSVILVGKNNDFGHPAPLTLAQLAGTIIYRTDQQGRICFIINSSGLKLQ